MRPDGGQRAHHARTAGLDCRHAGAICGTGSRARERPRPAARPACEPARADAGQSIVRRQALYARLGSGLPPALAQVVQPKRANRLVPVETAMTSITEALQEAR